MAGLVTLTRHAETLQGFQLTASDDMLAALKYLAGGGYGGHINLALNGSTPVWTMGLQSPGQTSSQSALIGDWIVIENNAVATVIPAAQFASLYVSS